MIRRVLLASAFAVAAVALAAESPVGLVPPEDFFTRPQFSSRFELALRGFGQRTAEALVDEIATNGLPVGVFLLEGRWASYPGSMRFEADEFPAPAALFDRIHAKDMRAVISMSCYVSPDSRAYRHFRYDPDTRALDHLLHRPQDRSAAIIRWRDGCSAAWDLTKPMAFGYFLDVLTTFMGTHHIDGFVFEPMAAEALADCGFHRPEMGPDDFLAAYGRLARYFPLSLYPAGNVKGAEAVARLTVRHHSWRDLGRIIPEALALGRRGVPFFVPDGVGGSDPADFPPDKANTVDQALFVRSCALQALFPMMQFAHAPWRALSAENFALCKDFVRLHATFAPYILEQARLAAKSGTPIVRAMDDVFPGQGFDRPLQQFMLGPKYLVAPVVTPDGTVTVEIPSGSWKDPRGMIVEGPKSLRLEKVPLSFLPYFERQ